MLILLTVLIKYYRIIEKLSNIYVIFSNSVNFKFKKNYKDLMKAETVSSKVVLFIVEGISVLRIIIIEISP